jgi:ribosome recycling factor
MAYDFTPLKKRIIEIEEWLKKELGGIRTGRASSSILDTLHVEAYGSMMPINQVANITNEDARTLRITPWDNSVIKDIERAITNSNLGLSTSVDDKGLRLNFPELTGERRTQLMKVAKEELEKARIEVRKERNKVMDDLESKKKDKTMGEDEAMRHKADTEKHIQDAMKRFDDAYAKKESEIIN